MKIGTYYNEELDSYCDHAVKHGQDLPKTIKKNGKVYKRFYGHVPATIVRQGKAGNAKNGYSGASRSPIDINPADIP